ncbi:MAG: Hsp20/alpha crystallin family protein [Pseudomonadota bacterium]
MASTSSRYPNPAASSGRELSSLSEPLFALHREVNRMFDDLFRTSLWPVTAAQQVTQQMTQQVTQQAQQAAQLLTAPRLDLEETDDEICITTDLPGVEQSDVEVKIEGNTLTICGERKSSSDVKHENFHLMERSRGRFERTVMLPYSSNAEQAEASFENGVLTVRLPKEETQRSRRIEVKRGQSQDQTSQSRPESQNGQYSTGDQNQSKDLSASKSQQPGQSASSSGQQPSSASSSSVGGSSGAGGKTSASSSDPSRKQPQPA